MTAVEPRPARRQPPQPRTRWRPDPHSQLGCGVTVALLVLVAVPLSAVVAQVFLPGLFFGDASLGGPGLLGELFARPLWRASLVNSLTLATGTMVLGTGIGTGLALVRHAYRFRGVAAIDVAAWSLLIMPSFVLAQGWVLFGARSGLISSWLGSGLVTDLIFSPGGLIVVMSLTNFPFAYLTVSAALAWDIDRYLAAARLCGAGPLRVLRTVRLPLLVPALASGAVLVFVDTIGDFGLPAALATTYRFPTLPYTIYTAISQSPIRFDLAGVLAVYLTLIIVVAVAIQFRVMRRGFYDFLTARTRPAVRPRPRLAPLFTLGTAGFLAVALGIPVGTSALVSVMEQLSTGPILSNLTFAHYAESLAAGSRFREALGNSLWIAGCAALGSVVLGLLVGYVLTFSRFRLRRLIDVTCTVTLAVPGVILGVGYVFVWNQPWLDRLGLALYGRPAILVLAAIAGAVPIAVRVTLGALAQVPESFLHAAALQGASLTRRLRSIVAPLAAGALLSATLAAFGTSMFDLAVTTILRPPGYEVLPYTINRQFQQGMYGVSTAGTMLGAAVTITIIAGVHYAVKRLLRRQQEGTRDA